MIYENYHQVPDGALCMPVTKKRSGKFFYPKDEWLHKMAWDDFEMRDILGKWETEEKTITITEREFDEAVVRAHKITNGFLKIDILKKELFK